MQSYRVENAYGVEVNSQGKCSEVVNSEFPAVLARHLSAFIFIQGAIGIVFPSEDPLALNQVLPGRQSH